MRAIARSESDRHLLRWTFILCGLFALAAPAESATRLGLHVTQEELNCWRQRAGIDPPGTNGITCPVMYKSAGDVSTNSPGDWSRIVSFANTFLSNPAAERWKGQTTATCAPLCGSNPCPVSPGRAQGQKLEAAAFYALVTGDTRYRDAVRTELLAQAAEPGANFADTTRWCSNLTGDGAPNFEIAGAWLARVLFAYDYIRNSLSAADKTTLDTWFRNAAVYWERAVHASLKNVFPNRKSNDYTTLGSNWQIESTQCTWYHCVTHYNGWKRVNWHEAWNNRDGGMMRTVGLIGIVVNDSVLKMEAKRFFKEWMRFSVFPDGTAQEFVRWEATYPSLGWAYAAALIGSMATLADAFGRSSDPELLDHTTSEGLVTSAGTMTPLGGPKNLRAVMTMHAQHVNKAVIRYGTDQASLNGNPSYVIGSINLPNGEAWVNENFWMPVNLYYQDSFLKSIYLRTAAGAPAYPVSPSTGGWASWTGEWGIYPGVLFMFGQMEGLVWPYGSSSLRGDLNAGGTVDISDLRLLIQMIIGQTPADLVTADLDSDGQLTLGDVRELINILISP